MKRNQMLRIIANTIYNNSMRSSMLETLPLAEKVLIEVEKAGAIPPCPCGCFGYEWEKDSEVLDPMDPTIWSKR